MGCGGCATRRDALVRGAVAIAEGRGEDALKEARRFADSAANDAAKVRDAVAANAARVREMATARLGMRRR